MPSQWTPVAAFFVRASNGCSAEFDEGQAVIEPLAETRLVIPPYSEGCLHERTRVEIQRSLADACYAPLL